MTQRNTFNAQVDYVDLESERWRRNILDRDFHHLLNSMSALKSEKAGVPAIPLNGKTDSSIVDDFYAYSTSKGCRYPEWQLEYELSRKSKYGDQGGRAAWETLKPEVEMYVLNPSPCKVEPILETIKVYRGMNLSKQSLREVLKQQKSADRIQRTASSWRRFALKKTDLAAQQDALQCAANNLWRESYAYVFSYIRKQKNRIFIPGPFSLNLLQAQLHDPFLAYIQTDLRANGSKSKFTFWSDKIGFRPMFNIMTQKRRNLDFKHIVYVVRDFYHMDTTQGEDQKKKHYVPKIAQAFNIKPGSTAYKEMEDILCYSNRMPIATPSGVITNVIKGEASGVTVTNQGETACNEDFDFVLNKRILAECKKENINVFRIDTYGNGDDGFSRYYLYDLSKFARFREIIEEAAEFACDMFGYMKNEKWKINLGTYGLYNQYEIYTDDEGDHYDYPVSLALNAIQHPMHEIPKELWDSDYIDWRTANILAHCYGRRDFENAVDFVDNSLKYGLFGHTKEDFVRIFSKYEKYRALQDAEDQYNIDDPQWREDPKYNPVIIYIAQKRGIDLRNLSAH